jgi:hypothetical protein
MRKSYLFLLIGIILSSCMKTVSISTMRPAAINIPSEVQTIVLVDRTKYERDAIGILEGVLTGEGINEDKDGVTAMFSALQNNLRNSPRFVVKQEPQRLIGNTVTGAFPDPLSWRIVNDLCRRHNADAVLAVEVFDSDFIITDGKREKTKTIKDDDGNERKVKYTEFFAEGVGSVRIGVRLYNAVSNSIEDQDIYTQNRTWEASATSIKEAMAQMVQKSQATKSLGGAVGATYAGKIAPMPVYLSRSYYAKPKKNEFMSRGARQASVNQWEEAISTWKTGIRNSNDSDLKGKLAYNVALGYEVMGDFRTAKDWAARSYVEYGEKKGQNYAAQLENRMRQEEILNQQLSQPEPADEGNKIEKQGNSNVIKLKVKD